MLPCNKGCQWNFHITNSPSYPIEFMYGIFTYIWLIFYGKSVGKYTVLPMDPAGIGGRKPPPSGCLDNFLCRSISSTLSAIGNKSTKSVPICGVAPQNEMFFLVLILQWFATWCLSSSWICLLFLCQTLVILPTNNTHWWHTWSHVSPAKNTSWIFNDPSGHMFWFLGLLKMRICYLSLWPCCWMWPPVFSVQHVQHMRLSAAVGSHPRSRQLWKAKKCHISKELPSFPSMIGGIHSWNLYGCLLIGKLWIFFSSKQPSCKREKLKRCWLHSWWSRWIDFRFCLFDDSQKY